ncbi:hypothetical protein E2C01_043699 [Portunus trituberculatus]|uniref:Uncharacterized protein n=1 Tax=Portunus trituberculatus TaxID=210409 RepID=A0A5B7FY07_PORTR|nr:hypothetical protein [Portunus trituberculatus]
MSRAIQGGAPRGNTPLGHIYYRGELARGELHFIAEPGGVRVGSNGVARRGWWSDAGRDMAGYIDVRKPCCSCRFPDIVELLPVRGQLGVTLGPSSSSVCVAKIRAQRLLKATADGTHRPPGSPSAYSGVENIFTVCQRRIRITGPLKVSAVTSRALHLAALNGGPGGRERRGGGT